MEICQLEAFLAVVTHGGFRRAAQALDVSQSSISNRIRALEESLAIQLFVRGRSEFSVSPAGKAFRPHAENLLRTVAKARQAVNELQPDADEPLRIAAVPSICAYFLPDVMKEYQQSNPKVMMTLRSGASMRVLKMVLDGEADLGIARSVNHPKIETTTPCVDPLVLVGHPDHSGTRKRQISLQQAEALPLIFYNRGSGDWTLSQSLFRRAGLLPNVVLEVESIETAKRMVEYKLGLSFLPQIALTQELDQGELVGIEVTDADDLCRSLDVIHLRDRPLSKAANAFLRLLRFAVGGDASAVAPSECSIPSPPGRLT